MIRAIFLACLLTLTAASSHSATISLTGTVFGVSGPSEFTNAVPIQIGDAFNMTATVEDKRAPDTTSSGTFYYDVFTALSGQVGGYAFSLSTTPDAYSPIPVNRAYLADNVSGRDRIETRASVAGGLIGDYRAALFSHEVRDDTAGVLTGEAYDPALFGQPLVNALAGLPLSSFGGLQYDAQASLLFRTDDTRAPTYQIFIDLKAAPISPVPLPSSGLLALAGLIILPFATRKRRAT